MSPHRTSVNASKSPVAIAIAIALTLIFTVIVANKFYVAREFIHLANGKFARNPDIRWETILVGLGYAIAHPLIGKLLHSATVFLSRLFDSLFNLDQDAEEIVTY